jgi:hypothetical protein
VSATRICFTPRTLGEFTACVPRLQEILAFLALIWPDADLEVTCIHRTPEEEAAAGGKSGIHVAGPPYRAIDVRVRNISGDPQGAADALGAKVNERYAYDPARPEMECAFTAPHGTGPHIHLQVHPATTRRVNPSVAGAALNT